MKYFSMFSGIGGFEKGIEDAFNNSGIASTSALENGQHIPIVDSGDGDGRGTNPMCIGFSEIDKNAINIYLKHYPGHKNYGSAFDINAAELPDFDLLVAADAVEDTRIRDAT